MHPPPVPHEHAHTHTHSTPLHWEVVVVDARQIDTAPDSFCVLAAELKSES